MSKDKEREKEIKKAYYEANKLKILQKRKEYRETNKILLNEKRKASLDKINNQRRIWAKNKRDNDPMFKLRLNLSHSISKSITRFGFKKLSKTEIILGCSFECFISHLESQFEQWMNWDNYGNPKDGILEPNKTWDIDHKIPTSSATTEIELLKLNHFYNLQPLCSYYNRNIKRDNI